MSTEDSVHNYDWGTDAVYTETTRRESFHCYLEVNPSFQLRDLNTMFELVAGSYNIYIYIYI